MLCSYTGTDQRRYLDYRDATTGRVLEVAVGGVYDVEVASGQAPGLQLPPGDGRWTATVTRKGVFEVTVLPPVSAADLEPAAPVISEEAGGSPAEEES